MCFVVFVTEIEAKEACKWLRAAGFPQYAQMYEGEYYLPVINIIIIIIIFFYIGRGLGNPIFRIFFHHVFSSSP